jgi:uncharacterized protein YecE (DUF72 family)
MIKLHVGLSGYDYKEWQGDGLFYSPSVKRASFLSDYARQFNSLEANGTFQRMPTESTITKWIESTGPDFTVSPKMVQNVTHFKRLSDDAIVIAKEFVKVLEPLAKAEKLGPILVQLPPNLKRDDNRLETFLSAMSSSQKFRWAFEFRNQSWACEEVAEILRKYGAAFVSAETDNEDGHDCETADFIFVRLRRLTYSDEQLQVWANRINQFLTSGKECFIYCRHKDTVMPWKWGERLLDLVTTG